MRPEFYLKKMKTSRRFWLLRRLPVLRILIAAITIPLVWHFVLYASMRARYDERIHINPIRNVMRVPYTIEGLSGRISSDNAIVLEGSARAVLEERLQNSARRYFDVYALVMPWTIELELQ